MNTEEIRKALAETTPGPWGWYGNTDSKELHLATHDRGRLFVMRFSRWGMQDAQPMFQVPPGNGKMVPVKDLVVYEVNYRRDFHDINHPDARFIANSWEFVEFLLEQHDQLEAVVKAYVAKVEVAAQTLINPFNTDEQARAGALEDLGFEEVEVEGRSELRPKAVTP